MLKPDWEKQYTVPGMEADLGITFSGPGIYIDADQDCLIVYSMYREFDPDMPTNFWTESLVQSHTELFNVQVFNGRAEEVQNYIKALQIAPIRQGLVKPR